VTAKLQLTLGPVTADGLREISVADANHLLTRWGHYLGPCRRPIHQEGWALFVADEPVSVAVSASTVSATAAGLPRRQVVELARLCSAEAWATRLMLRLWREVAAPAWQSWPVTAAVAYSHNSRHEDRIYRFDGWQQITRHAGSGGGGAWTRPRRRGDPSHGSKTLWVWRYRTETTL
jgi:hypothetical protein